MTRQPYLYFHISLSNHRYYDEHIKFPTIEPNLWRCYAFDNEGANWLSPIERDLDNYGARLFERAKQDGQAQLFAHYNAQRAVMQ